MSIASGTILVGGTSSATGGTSTGLIEKGNSLTESRCLLDDGSAYTNSTSLQFLVKDPVPNPSAPNGFTQKRSSIRLLVPLALDNGNTTINSVAIQLSVDPETTDAEIDALRSHAAQVLFDSDFDEFWQNQSVS